MAYSVYLERHYIWRVGINQVDRVAGGFTKHGGLVVYVVVAHLV